MFILNLFLYWNFYFIDLFPFSNSYSFSKVKLKNYFNALIKISKKSPKMSPPYLKCNYYLKNIYLIFFFKLQKTLKFFKFIKELLILVKIFEEKIRNSPQIYFFYQKSLFYSKKNAYWKKKKSYLPFLIFNSLFPGNYFSLFFFFFFT